MNFTITIPGKKRGQLLALLAALALLLPLRAQQPYFQQEVNYRIEVRLNDEAHSLSATEEIHYINNSPAALDVLYFHLWPNAYRDGHTALARQLINQGKTDLLYSRPDERGFIDSLDFKVNGEKVAWELDRDNPDICKLTLSSPLRSLDTLVITTPFYVKIPDAKFSRLGHTGQAYFITQWYPKPAVFDNTGWHPMPYLDQGEFYSEFGSFDVRITLPENYLLAATGDRIDAAAEEEFLNRKVIETLERMDKQDYRAGDMDFPASFSATKTIRFRQYRVHDFAWFADKRFNVVHDQFDLPTSGRPVDTWVFFTNKNFALWKDAITYVNEATMFYSYLVGDYPYNHVTAVDGTIMAGGGMEYPNITVIGDMDRPEELDVTIAHEVGHNWFYGILGNNERDQPLMDEGINSFYELRYTRAKYPGKTLAMYVGRDSSFRFLGLNRVPYWKEKEVLFMMAQRARIDQPLNLTSDQYSLFNYGSIIYGKAPLVFDYLLDYMGEENFDKAMRFYYEQFRFRHPRPADLFKTLSFYSGKDLNWLSHDLVETTRPIDYKIKRVRQNSDGSFSIRVKNKTGLASPINLYGFKDGRPVGLVWYDGFVKQRKLDFPPADVDQFRIDGGERMPDINRQNNVSRAHGLFKKAKRLQLNFITRFEDPERNAINWLPLVGANKYNGFMLGAAVYNYGIWDKPFDYVLAPFFAFNTKTAAGFAELNYSFYPQGIFKSITVGAKAKSFAYDLFDPRLLNEFNGTNFSILYFNYYKIAPQIRFELRPLRGDAHTRQFLTFTSNQLFTDSLDTRHLADLATTGPKARNCYSFVNTLRYDLINSRSLNPYQLEIDLQHTGSMAKVSATYAYRIQTGKRHVMDVRLFAGAFIAGNNNERAYYAFRPDGYTGSDDYLFNYDYIGRNRQDSPGYNQFTEVDGAMKVPVLFGNGRSWMAGVNIKSPKIFILPVRVFVDAVVTDKADLLNDPFLWDAGLNIPIFRDILEVYLPLFYSTDIRNTLDLNGLDFGKRVRFVLNIHKLVPKDFIKNNFVK